MTVSDILTIVGGSSHNSFESFALETADRHAAKFLKDQQGIFFTDESNYDERFLELSRAIDDRFDQWVAHLKTFPPKVEVESADADHDAFDAAMNVRGIETRAAYYFGLAIGLRLAGGA
jgi:hypothetical protein